MFCSAQLYYLFFYLFCVQFEDGTRQPFFLFVLECHYRSPQFVKRFLGVINLLDLRECAVHFTPKEVLFFVDTLSLK